MQVAKEIVRIFVVLALVAYAAALLTPKDRVPLALRGLAKLLGKELPTRDGSSVRSDVPFGKRLLGMILIIFAFVLAIIKL